jgi:hypothetical protein
MSKAVFLQLLAMDASARISMKDAAKCDKLCEWQNFENQQNAERILHFQVIPESISAFRALILYYCQNRLLRHFDMCLCVLLLR